MEEQAQEREAEREEFEEKLGKLRDDLKSHAKESPKVTYMSHDITYFPYPSFP